MIRNLITLFILIIVALSIRIPKITQRPLHVDEAVNAYILGELIETRNYAYNPGEYHGPSLYYFSGIFTSIAGVNSFRDLSELLIRIIPISAGVGIIVLTFQLGTSIRYEIGVVAASLIIFSPMAVYFDRYYIHENLLVLFSLFVIFNGYRLYQQKKMVYAIFFGISLGLLISTKETWVLYLFAMITAIICLRLPGIYDRLPGLKLSFIVFFSSFLVIILLYSSFFSNWQGLAALGESFIHYFERGTSTPEHTHPWYYYLSILFCYQENDILLFSEILLFITVIMGMIMLFKNRYGRMELFFASYLIAFLAVFSIIPYKTPWNILGVLPAMAIFGTSGLFSFWESIKEKRFRLFFPGILLLIFIFQCYTLWQINFNRAQEPENPFTYGHARSDVLLIGAKMDSLRSMDNNYSAIRVDVITENGNYWPLPWYLRHFSQVAWRDSVPIDIADVPIILISPALESKLITVLYEYTPWEKRTLYLPLFERDMELRPGTMIRGYIKKSLWDQINQKNIKL